MNTFYLGIYIYYYKCTIYVQYIINFKLIIYIYI